MPYTYIFCSSSFETRLWILKLPKIWDTPMILTEKHHVHSSVCVCVCSKRKVLLILYVCHVSLTVDLTVFYIYIYILLLLSIYHSWEPNIPFNLSFLCYDQSICNKCEVSIIQTGMTLINIQESLILHQINMENMNESIEYKNVFAHSDPQNQKAAICIKEPCIKERQQLYSLTSSILIYNFSDI